MLLTRPSDILAHIGHRLGPSDWLTVSQRIIDAFADLTDDHNWVHVDIERAKQELPGGVTIAHGFLTLSLIPRLTTSIVEFATFARGLNYGSNRVRFTGPVPSGSRIRLSITVKDAQYVGGVTRMTFDNEIEVEGQPRPALVAETVYLYYD